MARGSTGLQAKDSFMAGPRSCSCPHRWLGPGPPYGFGQHLVAVPPGHFKMFMMVST